MFKQTVKAGEIFEIRSVRFEMGMRGWTLKREPVAILDVDGFDFAHVQVSAETGQIATDILKAGKKAYIRMDVIEAEKSK